MTVTGLVAVTSDGDGDASYTLTSGATTYKLEAGPPWFFGDAYPLKPYVGKNVTVVGEQDAGSSEIDVLSVDGTQIRAPGKPPWAGGWKRVGSIHPGWSQEKADRWQAKAEAKGVDCWPPGHCKAPRTPVVDDERGGQGATS